MENIKIIKSEKMFCSICEEEHEVDLIEEEIEIFIKGEKIKHKERKYRCNKHTEENVFETEELWDKNLINSLDTYRKEKNLLTSKEIRNIRNKYKLTQTELAQLIGIEEEKIIEYETKKIQNEKDDKIIKAINKNEMLALEYIEKNKKNFKDIKRYKQIEENIKKIAFNNIFDYLNEQEIINKYEDHIKEDIKNGYKTLDINKIKEITNYIAKNCEQNLYKVKLMKMLWYIDCLSYKENKKAITGLIYTHQKMGALPIGYDEIVKLSSVKLEEFLIEKDDIYICYQILPNEHYKGNNLSKKEKEICDRVIKKFKNYKTNEIIEYMHNEKAYIETRKNEVINFNYAEYINIEN